eukprot:350184-Chlamydomonas_euryale.AAC.1
MGRVLHGARAVVHGGAWGACCGAWGACCGAWRCMGRVLHGERAVAHGGAWGACCGAWDACCGAWRCMGRVLWRMAVHASGWRGHTHVKQYHTADADCSAQGLSPQEPVAHTKIVSAGASSASLATRRGCEAAAEPSARRRAL